MAIYLVLILTPSLLFAQSRILVVHSYHAGYEWTDSIQTGIDHAFSDGSYDIQVLYMDTKRQTDEAWKIKAGQRAMRKVAAFKPDVVITTDDNAQAYFAKQLAQQKDSPRIVFCGVNGSPELYGFHNKNVTGFLSRSHVTGTLKLAKALDPKIKRITFISDDSITSQKSYEYYRTLDIPMQVVRYVKVTNFSQWQSAVFKANQDSDAILVTMYHTVKQASNETMSMKPQHVMQWTVKNCIVPILGILPFTVKDGAMLGICSSGQEHGYLAGITAIDMIKTGRRASLYPINTSMEGKIMFNSDAVLKHGIRIPKSLSPVIQMVNTIKPVEQAAWGDLDWE
tara:strand:- start:193 stop:1209 length:1017 start_codon:yes stop_codon:yes gene_type:complete